MNKNKIYKVLITLISSVWFINGLFCKILNLVPRHKEIVSEILGYTYATELTILIGISEVVLAIWIISDFKKKLHATLQMTIVLTMNVIEFFLVPDLLLWGKLNLVFALTFVSLIHYTYFIYSNDYVKAT